MLEVPKIDRLRPYSFQVYQKYISKVREENLQKLLLELNRIAIGEGLEDLGKVRQNSTVVETNIHYPTNNSLVRDCIKEAHRLLEHLGKEPPGTIWSTPKRKGSSTLSSTRWWAG